MGPEFVAGGGCSNVTTLAGTSVGANSPCALQLQGGNIAANQRLPDCWPLRPEHQNNDELFIRVQHQRSSKSAILSLAAITEVDRRRVRKCDECVLHFRDTSKKGMRRWW
jgi:hypothetical protein